MNTGIYIREQLPGQKAFAPVLIENMEPGKLGEILATKDDIFLARLIFQLLSFVRSLDPRNRDEAKGELSTQDLECIAADIVAAQDAAGVVLMIFTKAEKEEDRRCEFIAVLREEFDDLPNLIRNMVDKGLSGEGYPFGGHLTKVKGGK